MTNRQTRQQRFAAAVRTAVMRDPRRALTGGLLAGIGAEFALQYARGDWDFFATPGPRYTAGWTLWQDCGRPQDRLGGANACGGPLNTPHTNNYLQLIRSNPNDRYLYEYLGPDVILPFTHYRGNIAAWYRPAAGWTNGLPRPFRLPVFVLSPAQLATAIANPQPGQIAPPIAVPIPTPAVPVVDRDPVEQSQSSAQQMDWWQANGLTPMYPINVRPPDKVVITPVLPLPITPPGVAPKPQPEVIRFSPTRPGWVSRALPVRGTKESKIGFAWSAHAPKIGEIMDWASEGGDLVDAIYKGLPSYIQNRNKKFLKGVERDTPKSLLISGQHALDPTVPYKLELIYRHFDQLDYGIVAAAIMYNMAEDLVIGRQMKQRQDVIEAFGPYKR